MANNIRDIEFGFGVPRSKGIIYVRREKNPWPENVPFRVLSIDGGGMRGLWAASFLRRIEELVSGSINEYFDLLVGTSTGGIICLALGKGMTSAEIAEFYISEGSKIFPYKSKMSRAAKFICLQPIYDRYSLGESLSGAFGNTKLGDSVSRLCITSCDSKYNDIYVYKTPHHVDFCNDWKESMVSVGIATSAAPVFFAPHLNNGYVLRDGGLWANNPIMIGVVEALTGFDIAPEQLRILSLGSVGDWDTSRQNKVWEPLSVIRSAFKFQSDSALGQAGLIAGRNNILRVCPSGNLPRIGLGDYLSSAKYLPVDAVLQANLKLGEFVKLFCSSDKPKYAPIYP